MISDEMGARSRHQGGEASDEVDGFEQHVSGAIGEGVFEFVDHQPIAIDAQALFGDGRASHIPAHALEFAARTGFAADGGIDRKPISWVGERFAPCRLIDHSALAPASPYLMP
jgi:hypothetical protein